MQTTSIRNYRAGSVIIIDKYISLNVNSYNKRKTVISNNIWITTKPFDINTIDIKQNNKS